MKPRDTIVIILFFGLAILVALGVSLYLSVSAPSKLVGNPAPASISAFLPTDYSNGQSFVLLSDSYIDECNERYGAHNDLLVRLQQSGRKILMLHASKHGFPSKSNAEAVQFNRGAPTHILIADSDVLYASRAIGRLPKPCLVMLTDGKITGVKTKDEFDRWVKQN